MADRTPTAAMGLIEVAGLSRGLRAANAAAQAAAVSVDGVGYVYNGIVMVTLRGDVASVQTAVAAAVDALAGEGVRSTSVIPRPDGDVDAVIRERSAIGPQGRAFAGPGGIGGFRSRVAAAADPATPPARRPRTTGRPPTRASARKPRPKKES